MVKIVFSELFLKAAKKLPRETQNKLAKRLELLSRNPFHVTIHTKRLVGELAGLYAFRITRDWRVIFNFVDEQTVKLIDVGHRKDIYK